VSGGLERGRAAYESLPWTECYVPRFTVYTFASENVGGVRRDATYIAKHIARA